MEGNINGRWRPIYWEYFRGNNFSPRSTPPNMANSWHPVGFSGLPVPNCKMLNIYPPPMFYALYFGGNIPCGLGLVPHMWINQGLKMWIGSICSFVKFIYHAPLDICHCQGTFRLKYRTELNGYIDWNLMERKSFLWWDSGIVDPWNKGWTDSEFCRELNLNNLLCKQILIF